MIKKFALFLSTIFISLASLLPLATATAAGPNLIVNPSVEIASGTQPTGWNQDVWGKNTTTFSHNTAEGHSGTKSLYINMTKRTGGDAKWYFTNVPVKPNTSYTYSEFYESNIKTEIDVAYTTAANTVSYNSLGTPAAAPTWTAATTTFTTPANVQSLSVMHIINRVGWVQTDDFSLVEGTGVVTPPTAPSVSITAPVANATVSGAVNIDANASDAVGVAGVQFKLDNTALGAEDTTAPYGVNWNTISATNGTHTLTATARNSSGLTATATETVTVQNNVVTPPGNNLILNSSLETTNGTAPASWLSSNWGNNTSAFSYLNTGHTGSHSVRVDTTAYTGGAANWYYAEIPVSSGKTYKYENWYQSNVDTEVDAEVTMTDGSVQYFWLGTVLTNTNWTKYSTTFTPPAGAKSIAIYQLLAKKGYVVSDDYSLSEYTPLPLNRGLVTVTFDDGWANQYTNAYPLLQKYGLNAAFYIISGELANQPDYMSGNQILALRNSGNEIGSHTISHPDLTTKTVAQITNEMSQSQTTLQNLLGQPVTDFAYPYGAYNATTIGIGKQYYQSQRSVNAGYNTKENWDITTLKIHEVDSNISQAQVQGWIDGAIAQKAWLILVYHEVATKPVDPTDALYTTQPSDLDAELAYLKNSGVTVKTVNQALNEILPQL
ncbi:MAG: hypothetical protein JWS12_98 [Candidatus Saccharibacteria bacterium]|nr:hypothetical protein [Candidatus Saccharibacteria bacterium]